MQAEKVGQAPGIAFSPPLNRSRPVEIAGIQPGGVRSVVDVRVQVLPRLFIGHAEHECRRRVKTGAVP